MSSHADTIREKAARRGRIDHPEGARYQSVTWDEVDELLDENQRLEEQRDTALRKIADWQAIAESRKAENQRLREALESAERALADAERIILGNGAQAWVGSLNLEKVREALAGDAE